MHIKYAIKDIERNEFFILNAAGECHVNSTGSFNTDIDKATVYTNKGAVTSFIKSFNKGQDKLKDNIKKQLSRGDGSPLPAKYVPIYRDLSCVKIEITHKEIP